MISVIAQLMLAAPPLPAAPWAVSGDGAGCAPVGAEILAELATWRADPDNTVVEEGIFGLVHPARPRALVLLFASREVCERITWAADAERAEQRAVAPMTADEVDAWLEARLRGDKALTDAWRALGAERQRGLRDETRALFAGQAHRRAVERAITAARESLKPRAGVKADPVAERRARLCLALWPELYAKVFAAPPAEAGGP